MIKTLTEIFFSDTINHGKLNKSLRGDWQGEYVFLTYPVGYRS